MLVVISKSTFERKGYETTNTCEFVCGCCAASQELFLEEEEILLINQNLCVSSLSATHKLARARRPKDRCNPAYTSAPRPPTPDLKTNLPAPLHQPHRKQKYRPWLRLLCADELNYVKEALNSVLAHLDITPPPAVTQQPRK